VDETDDADESAAQREREEQVRRDACRARQVDRTETDEFVRQLGFGELLDD